jgi:pimeloyl-ACP methyl ester carboxylesterase
MSPSPNAPDTIVLIHGFWVTPRSWEDWKARYEAAGYTVLTPAYPGYEVEVEALREDTTPTEGVPVVPFSQVRSTFPVLKNPANHHKAIGFDLDQWTYAFTNGFTDEQSKALYERYHIPASGRILWDSSLANLLPGHQNTWVDYHNDNRAPLLFISGDRDHLMPPKVQASNAKHYKSDKTVTEVKLFEGPHLLPSKDGWEAVADYALEWAVAHA